MNNHELQSAVSILQRIYGPVNAIALGPANLLQQGLLSSVECQSVTILDPDSQRAATWHAANPNSEDVIVLNRGLAQDASAIPFFRANIPHESSTIRPETLKSLWQNIRTVEEEEVQASNVEDIASETGRKFNWFVSEMINAADALLALGKFAENIEVVIARTVNDVSVAKEIPDISKPRLDEVAKSLGMLEVACLRNRHPKTATVIYMRHWKRAHEMLREQLSKASEDASNLKFELEQTASQYARDTESQTSQIRGLEATVRNAQNATEEARTTLRAQHKSLQDRDQSIANLKQKLEDTQARLVQRDNSHEELQKQHDAALSELEQSKVEIEMAEQKLKIAENNLNDLREKHKAQSDENLSQFKRLSEIESHLAAAVMELNQEPKRASTTRRARTKTKSQPHQKSSAVSE